MASNPGTIRRIAWRELLPWLHLVGTLRMAMRLRYLVPATVGVLMTIAGWWLIAQVFSGSDAQQVQELVGKYGMCPWRSELDRTNLPLVPIPGETDVFASPEMGSFPTQPYVGVWQNLSAPLRQLFDSQLSWVSVAFLLACGLWAVAVWSLIGGALSRMAAMELCREEKIGWSAAWQFARGRFLSYFGSPLLPLVGVVLLSLPLVLLGLLLRFTLGMYIAAILWPLALVAGLVMAIFLLGLFFGWPLMFPAISTEGTDSFDALSRSYSYTYQRPLHYLFYALVVGVLGLLGGVLVYYFLGGVVYLTDWAVSWGSGAANHPDTLRKSLAAETPGAGAIQLLGFWIGCVRTVAIGFAYAFFWIASTQIYLLLRYQTDGTEMDEVYLSNAAGDGRPLPVLERDAAGVPKASGSGSDASAGEDAGAERVAGESGHTGETGSAGGSATRESGDGGAAGGADDPRSPNPPSDG